MPASEADTVRWSRRPQGRPPQPEMMTTILVVAALAAASIGAGRVILDKNPQSRAPSFPNAVSGLTGLALLTSAAGWFVLAGAYSQAVGYALLFAGCVGLALHRRRADVLQREPLAARLLAGLLGLVILAFMVLRTLSELTTPYLNNCDDFAS